jgi:hypothetical protein
MLSCSGLNCCAVQQISGLSDYPATPYGMKKAMQDMCRNMFERSRGYGNPKQLSKPYSFYVFNGIVGFRKGSRDAPSYGRLGYVEAFKKFIEDNDLGEVTASTPEWNRVNASSHKVMMCVWRPDPPKVKKWWMANKPTTP